MKALDKVTYTDPKHGFQRRGMIIALFVDFIKRKRATVLLEAIPDLDIAAMVVEVGQYTLTPVEQEPKPQGSRIESELRELALVCPGVTSTDCFKAICEIEGIKWDENWDTSVDPDWFEGKTIVSHEFPTKAELDTIRRDD